MYGDGHLVEAARMRVRELGLDSTVSIEAPVRDICRVLKSIDVLCVPSLWEGFPNVVGEALSAGVPVCGFHDCDGVRDLVTDGVNGWLATDPRSTASFLGLLRRTADNLADDRVSPDLCRASIAPYSNVRVRSRWHALLREFN